MGSRGPRSAADMAAYRPQTAHDPDEIPIDVEALTRHFGDRREALRFLRRGERQGSVVCRVGPDGVERWFEV